MLQDQSELVRALFAFPMAEAAVIYSGMALTILLETPHKIAGASIVPTKLRHGA